MNSYHFDKILADILSWEEFEEKLSFAILRVKFVTNPVVKQAPGVGHMTVHLPRQVKFRFTSSRITHKVTEPR